MAAKPAAKVMRLPPIIMVLMFVVSRPYVQVEALK